MAAAVAEMHTLTGPCLEWEQLVAGHDQVPLILKFIPLLELTGPDSLTCQTCCQGYIASHTPHKGTSEAGEEYFVYSGWKYLLYG